MNLFILVLIFFVVGFLEMLTWSLQTKSLVKDKVVNTFIFSFLAIVIWFYVVSKVAENVNNVWLMFAYAFGCSFGNISTIKLDKYIDKLARARLWKKSKKKKTYRPIKKK